MRTILLFSLVSLINDTASKMILPVLPLYIEQIGGAGLAVGLVSGIGESVASVLKVLSGYWSDRLGRRKPFALWGYALSAASKLLLAWSRTWPMVLLLRSTERAGKGLRSAPRDVLLAAGASTSQKGRYFGIHRAFDSGGAVVGSLLSLLLVTVYHLPLTTIFLVAGGISFFSILPIFFVQEMDDKQEAGGDRLVIRFRDFSTQLKIFMAAGTFFSLGNFSWMFFVLHARQRGADDPATFTLPIVMYVVYQVVSTFGAVPAGILADRIGKVNVLMLGYGLFGLVCLGFMTFQGFTALVVLFAFYGGMFALVEANERAYVAELAPASVRGTALGTFFTLQSLAALPAGAVAGILYDAHPFWMFGYGCGFSVVAVLLLVWHRFRTGDA